MSERNEKRREEGKDRGSVDKEKEGCSRREQEKKGGKERVDI